MYEENLEPLPEGNAAIVFAEQLAEMKSHWTAGHAAEITPESVVRWADRRNQPYFAAICRRLLLPGSGIVAAANLGQLVQLAEDGKGCLLCLNHRSNLDVPTLEALLEDQADPKWFEEIIWVAGRKLEEDIGMTRMLVQCFNRVIVTPPSWFTSHHTEDEIHAGRLLNIAAERAIAEMLHEGRVFALFPSATRIRPDDQSTKQAIEQTDSYLRMFEYLLLCNIDGCTMPVSMDQDLTHETPKLDRMIYTFSSVQRTDEYRAGAAARFPELDQRMASARALTQDIDALAPK